MEDIEGIEGIEGIEDIARMADIVLYFTQGRRFLFSFIIQHHLYIHLFINNREVKDLS